MEATLKSRTVLDFMQMTAKSGTKPQDQLKLLEERIKSLDNILNEEDFDNYGKLFRMWMGLNNELAAEGGQNQEWCCCLFWPMIEYVVREKSNKKEINLIHLTQYQAELAVLWLRTTKSRTVLDFMQMTAKSGTKPQDQLKLLEERIKSLDNILNEEDFDNYGELFRMWIGLNNELGAEGGQNQECCCLFWPMIEYVVREKSSKSGINLIHLTQYQAELAVLRWLRTTICDLAEQGGQTIKVKVIVGKGLKSSGGPKLPFKLRDLFNEFGIHSEYFDGKVKAWFEDSSFLRLSKYFNLERDLEIIRTDPETKREVQRLINGFGHVLSLWPTVDVLESTVLEQVAHLTSLRMFETLSKPSKSSAAEVFSKMQEFLKKKPKNLEEVLATAAKNKIVIYTFTPFSTKTALKEGTYKDIVEWENVSKVQDFIKDESLTLNYALLRAEEKEEVKKTGIKPFGERLRTVVDELDLIKTTKTVVLIVHLNFESKRASSFIRHNPNWSQFMIDDLF